MDYYRGTFLGNKGYVENVTREDLGVGFGASLAFDADDFAPEGNPCSIVALGAWLDFFEGNEDAQSIVILLFFVLVSGRDADVERWRSFIKVNLAAGWNLLR